MPLRRKKKRRRRGYVRPSRAKPKVGWSLRELSQLTRVESRTIRMYLQREVLPRPAFMGPATRYQKRQLVWLLAIRRLRETEKLSLKAIRARLLSLSPDEVEAIATMGVAAGPLADALGLKAPAQATGGMTSGAAGASLIEPSLSPQGPRWARVELALGLELHLRDDASPRVLELARRVRELCA